MAQKAFCFFTKKIYVFRVGTIMKNILKHSNNFIAF